MLARDQLQTRGQGGAPRCGVGRSHASTIDRHQVPPARSTSLARNSGRGVPTRLGRFFQSTSELLEFAAMTRAGLRAEVALANIHPQIGHQASNQFADAAEIVHVPASKVAGLDDLEASDKDFAGEQKDSASGAKID